MTPRNQCTLHSRQPANKPPGLFLQGREDKLAPQTVLASLLPAEQRTPGAGGGHAAEHVVLFMLARPEPPPPPPGALVIHEARYGWAGNIWAPAVCSHSAGCKDVTSILRADAEAAGGQELHMNPHRAPQYCNQVGCLPGGMPHIIRRSVTTRLCHYASTSGRRQRGGRPSPATWR